MRRVQPPAAVGRGPDDRAAVGGGGQKRSRLNTEARGQLGRGAVRITWAVDLRDTVMQAQWIVLFCLVVGVTASRLRGQGEHQCKGHCGNEGKVFHGEIDAPLPRVIQYPAAWEGDDIR